VQCYKTQPSSDTSSNDFIEYLCSVKFFVKGRDCNTYLIFVTEPLTYDYFRRLTVVIVTANKCGHCIMTDLYGVSIKSFHDYKHLLKENYCMWNTKLFFSKRKSRSFFYNKLVHFNMYSFSCTENV